MSLPDTMIIPYLENLTDISEDELSQIRHGIQEKSVNPMNFKKRLALELVSQFHDLSSAKAAATYFEKTVQSGDTPEDIPFFDLPSSSELATKRLSDVLVESNLAKSSSDARRVINQKGVKVNSETVTENIPAASLNTGDIIHFGRRKAVQIKSSAQN